MPTQPEQAKSEVMDRIADMIQERVAADRAAKVESFMRQFYRRVDPADLLQRTVPDLYGAALAQWSFARQRMPGAAKVRVYSPRFEEHGWRSVHSVVEIVTDDMPFLVDSVSMELNRQGLVIHLPIHPVLTVRRDDEGELLEVLPDGASPAGGLRESIIHIEVDRQTEPEVLERIHQGIERVLADVRAAFDDWGPMRERVREILTHLADEPPKVDPDELAEARSLLEWIDQGNFTFLGYRVYDLDDQGGEDVLRPVRGTGLGILRETADRPLSPSFAKLPPEVRRLAREPHLLVLTKANSKATVHRPSYLDYIGIKRFDADGDVIGEWRFLGLYTSAAYNRNPREIPVLRRKVTRVLESAGLPPGGHDWKALQNILETFPREELFQVSEEQLFDVAMGILSLEERRRVRLFMWRDRYGRFVSCLVYVPRDRYTTAVRRRIEEVLTQALDGESLDFSVRLTESVLARLYFIIRMRAGHRPEVDALELEGKLAEATRSWSDQLHGCLLDYFGEEQGNLLYGRYAEAFPAAYREDFPALSAIYDIQRLEELLSGGDSSMSLYRPLEAPRGTLRFKLLSSDQPLPLSEAVPMLEAMGVRVVEERPYGVHPLGAPPAWIHDFGLSYTSHDHEELDLHEVRGRFQEAFTRALRGDSESDGFNQLVLAAGLTWREIVVLRACCKYLRQTKLTFSQSYMEEALAANPAIARAIVELFRARFDPATGEDRDERVAGMEAAIGGAIDAVANLDQDRILRAFLDLVRAMTRTNFFQTTASGDAKPYLAFKLDPSQVPYLPRPRPMFEIFVYSPRTEAVHLRGGRVARGGIRWSDRREDFRTEILGLVKAQTVKNAVIVPTGAKGGFVLKAKPGASARSELASTAVASKAGSDREALMAEGVACYRLFISALLDVTDNLDGGKIVPPRDVVRHDGDDPYLVVAADKGTATFSDIANEISQAYGFWLGDAFASGGSAGYDHKKMGITARGAWESVKRHFRVLDRDIQSEDFTTIGIGDMSGDVFGNGMLLSEHTRLVAAFDHRHIFVDPRPDAASSYVERRRLFELPRSSWDDYDRSLISKGGGVWPRGAKSVPVSAQMREALGIADKSVTALAPTELIKTILKAPVDLLWNGGIGTYVKASAESQLDVGDKANDPVRVNGRDLRVKVVGEGGNLGLTERGRVEFALLGGHIVTDFIDNSAGVDCSDHEVNIKILLGRAIDAGELDEPERNTLLAGMTDEVAELVLRDNYQQATALGNARAQSLSLLPVHRRMLADLERRGLLDRELEALPSDDELNERGEAGTGLTSPEFAVLLAYVKITLDRDILESTLPDEEWTADVLADYFPTPLRERYSHQMAEHRLRREIVTTQLVNEAVNRSGTSFFYRAVEESGASPADVLRAYVVVKEVYGLGELWRAVEALDNRVSIETQTAVYLEVRRLLDRAVRWLVSNRRSPIDVPGEIERLRPGVSRLLPELGTLFRGNERLALRTHAAELVSRGLPEQVADLATRIMYGFGLLDIVETAHTTDRDVAEVASVYFVLSEQFRVDDLLSKISALPREDRWQTLARMALRYDLYAALAGLTAEVLASTPAELDAEERVYQWEQANAAAITRARNAIGEFDESRADLAPLSVLLRQIRTLVRTSAAA